MSLICQRNPVGKVSSFLLSVPFYEITLAFGKKHKEFACVFKTNLHKDSYLINLKFNRRTHKGLCLKEWTNYFLMSKYPV